MNPLLRTLLTTLLVSSLPLNITAQFERYEPAVVTDSSSLIGSVYDFPITEAELANIAYEKVDGLDPFLLEILTERRQEVLDSFKSNHVPGELFASVSIEKGPTVPSVKAWLEDHGLEVIEVARVEHDSARIWLKAENHADLLQAIDDTLTAKSFTLMPLSPNEIYEDGTSTRQRMQKLEWLLKAKPSLAVYPYPLSEFNKHVQNWILETTGEYEDGTLFLPAGNTGSHELTVDGEPRRNGFVVSSTSPNAIKGASEVDIIVKHGELNTIQASERLKETLLRQLRPYYRMNNGNYEINRLGLVSTLLEQSDESLELVRFGALNESSTLGPLWLENHFGSNEDNDIPAHSLAISEDRTQLIVTSPNYLQTWEDPRTWSLPEPAAFSCEKTIKVDLAKPLPDGLKEISLMDANHDGRLEALIFDPQSRKIRCYRLKGTKSDNFFYLQQAVDRDDSGLYVRTSKDFILPKSVRPVGVVKSKINPNGEYGSDFLVLVFDESLFEPTVENLPNGTDIVNANLPLEKWQVLFITLGERGVLERYQAYGIDFNIPAPDWEPTALKMETLAQGTSTFLATFSNGDKKAKFRTRFGK